MKTRIIAVFLSALIIILLSMNNLPSHSFASSVGGGANGAVVTGSVRLAGLPVNVSLTGAAPVTLPPTGGSSTNQITSVTSGALGVNILQTGLIVNTTSGTVGSPASHAESTSTVNGLNVLGGLVTGGAIISKSTSDCTGQSASSTGTGSTVENLVVAGNQILEQPAPNTVITITDVQLNLLGIGLVRVNGTVTLNEQITGGNGVDTSSLTVNQIHVNVVAQALIGLARVEANVIVASASSSVSCDSVAANQCPSVNVAGGNTKTVQAGQTLTFQVSATDPDGNAVTLTATNVPANASFSPNPATGTPSATGTFNFTPAAGQANQTFTVNFTATDNNGCSSGSATPVPVQINVTSGPPPNQCPLVNVTGGTTRTTQVGDTVSFQVSATDPDGDAVTLTATNVPANATFNPNPATGTPTATGTFSFTPNASQVNQTFTVNFTATDNNGCSSGSATPVPVQITVFPDTPSGPACTGTNGGGANGASVTGSVRLVGAPVNVSVPSVAPVTLPPTGGSFTNTVASANAGALGVNILQTGTVTNTTSGTFGSSSHAESTSTVNGLNILGGLVSATEIVSKATSDCNGQSATSIGTGSTVENLVVAGDPIVGQPAPNTVITITNAQLNIAGIGLVRVNGTVTLNEQIKGGNGTSSSSLTVNQIHVNLVAEALVGLARVEADVIVASATACVACAVAPLNQCPVVSVSGGTTRSVQAGQTLSFSVSATDPDGNAVTLTATNLPANATFTPNPATGTPTASGTFSFTPAAGQANQTFNVSFTATDSNGCSAGTATPVVAQITVTPPPNNCPTVTVTGGTNRAVQVGQTLTFSVSATDSDGNAVTLTASGLPANATFTPNPATGTPTATGTFSFTPAAGQANQTFTVNFTATDNNGCSAGSAIPVPVQVTVTPGAPPNQCPIITITGGTTHTIEIGQTLSFQVAATDPDGNAVTLTASGLPANATFTPNPATGTPTASGTFIFTPSLLQVGLSFSVSFRATDNNGCNLGASVPLTVSIFVPNLNPENLCPVITITGGLIHNVQAGQSVTLQVSATDPDGDAVTLVASNLPPNASFSPNPATGTPTATGTLTFNPSTSQAGQTFNISFTASDNGGCSGGVPIPVIASIIVGGGSGGGGSQSRCGNHAPMISVPSLPVVGEGEKLEFMVKVHDEDLDDVTLIADYLPDNAEFESATGKFTFTPTAEQLQQAQTGQGIIVIFSATDSKGATAKALVDITPVASTTTPRPPVLSVPPGPILVKTIDRLSFAVAGLSQSASCAVTLSASDMPGGSTFSTSTNMFSLTPIASLANKPFLVNFTATDCAGRTREAAVRIIVIEADSNCNPLGNGIISVPTTRLIFGNAKVGDRNGATSVSITNRGGGLLMINSLTLSDTSNYRLEGISELPLTLQPGGVIEFKVFFEPKRKGNAPAVLTIFSSDADTPAYEIQLKGKGTN